jgi:LPXTG-motif cell wall-anchored protein
MKISRWAAVAVGLAVGGLALASPASAHHNEVSVDIQADGCQLTASSAWASDEHLSPNAVVVVRVAGEVHTAEVGDQLDVELAPGTTAVQWRTWGGGERDYDDPALQDLQDLLDHLQAGGDVLDGDAPGVAWHELAVEGCEPEPTPTVDPTPDPTVEPTVEPTTEPCVDVNEATAEELLQLMHVDADRAQQILELRPFASVDDLGRVDGLATGGPRLAELVAGGDGFLPLCAIDEPGDEQLPTTGVPAAGLAVAGGAAAAVGGGALWLARRRRTTFAA